MAATDFQMLHYTDFKNKSFTTGIKLHVGVASSYVHLYGHTVMTGYDY